MNLRESEEDIPGYGERVANDINIVQIYDFSQNKL